MTHLIEDPDADARHPWEVWVNAPFHLSGEGEQYRIGAFATCDEARDACRRVIDEFLAARAPSAADAGELFTIWEDSGPEPWVKVVAGRAEPCPFAAEEHARQRCEGLLPPQP